MKRLFLVMCLVSVFLLAWMVPVSATPVTGAIWTTNSSGAQVNGNIYPTKEDVYLNGGPKGSGGGLPDGSYYVQVTNPNGHDVLGTSVGSSTPQPVIVTSGQFAELYQLWDIVFHGTHQGYNDTTNNGGEYKVWVSTVATFDNSDTKTDNFKVGSTAIVIVKETLDGYNGTFNFTGENGSGGSGLDSSFDITTVDGTGSQAFIVKKKKTYSILENPTGDWIFDHAVVSNGDPIDAIYVNDGETVTVTFYNKKEGTGQPPVPEAPAGLLLGLGLAGIGTFIVIRRRQATVRS